MATTPGGKGTVPSGPTAAIRSPDTSTVRPVSSAPESAGRGNVRGSAVGLPRRARRRAAREPEQDRQRWPPGPHAAPHSPPATPAPHWCCCTRCDGVQRMDSLVLEKASILCYRLYDVADEIDLGVAESVLARDCLL